jgi:hypothetical protein
MLGVGTLDTSRLGAQSLQEAEGVELAIVGFVGHWNKTRT